MRKFFLFVLASLLFNLVPSLSYADDFKIATVNMSVLLNKSKAAQSKRASIDAQSTDVKKKIETKKQSLQGLEKKLKEDKVADDSKEAEKFREQAREYSRYVKDAEDDLRKQLADASKELAKDAIKTIADYSKENKIDFVFDKSVEMGGPLLYGDSALDITNDVLTKLDSK